MRTLLFLSTILLEMLAITCLGLRNRLVVVHVHPGFYQAQDLLQLFLFYCFGILAGCFQHQGFEFFYVIHFLCNF